MRPTPYYAAKSRKLSCRYTSFTIKLKYFVSVVAIQALLLSRPETFDCLGKNCSEESFFFYLFSGVVCYGAF